MAISIKNVVGKSIVSCLLLVTGCATVGPDYVRPEMHAPQNWPATSPVSSPAGPRDSRALALWWETFHDPQLSALIDRAVTGNLDLKKAQAAVREARALRGVSAADQYPSLDATASASKQRTSRVAGIGTTQTVYAAGLDATWELDIFGGKRRAVEAAQADLEASEADLNSVLVSLVGEVALNYVDLRSSQAKLAIAEASKDAQTETYQIAEWRHEAGLATQLDLEQAKMSLEQTRAQIPLLQSGLAAAKNRLAVLLGKHPGALDAELSEQKPVPKAELMLAVGIPADALRSRPDVQIAERQLAAQTARIGVATADLYPKLTLTGSIGLEALSPGKVFSGGSEQYGLTLPITWNIFDAGRVRRNIKVQTSRQEQALVQYEAVILAALEEVENALTAYANEQDRLRSLTAAEQAALQAFELAKTRYTSGLTDFQVVLDSQRSLLTVQELRAISDTQATSDLIRLYKAVGGGWTPLSGSDEQLQKKF